MTTPDPHSVLRTDEDIFAAGYAKATNRQPLTEEQVNELVVILAPLAQHDPVRPDVIGEVA